MATIDKWIDKRATILVVDDSVDNRNLISSYLKQVSGYKVVFAKNGQEAVDIFRRRTISLILMDMEMPVMDGYTATAVIRNLEHGQDIPIIALTAHQGGKEVKKCLDAGCTAYMSKPIRKQKLLKTLEQHLVFRDRSAEGCLVESSCP
ncbi:MAG: response regulator [bacterium]